MNPTNRLILISVLFSLVGLTRPVQAQFAVIDVGAITQLLVEVQQLENQLQVAQAHLAQARQAYSAMTGGRGMQLLLSNTNRNYLPATWAQLTGTLNAAQGAYGALSSDVTATVNRNAVLTAGQISLLSSTERNTLASRRESVALLEALARAALANTSNRFASIQQLINAIPSATDEKGILDLQARIGAEQGMLANEATKLQVLYQAAESQAQTERARADEQAIADIGHLRDLPPMGLQ
jgi:type IV secretion system protein VirB5